MACFQKLIFLDYNIRLCCTCTHTTREPEDDTIDLFINEWNSKGETKCIIFHSYSKKWTKYLLSKTEMCGDSFLFFSLLVSWVEQLSIVLSEDTFSLNGFSQLNKISFRTLYPLSHENPNYLEPPHISVSKIFLFCFRDVLLCILKNTK